MKKKVLALTLISIFTATALLTACGASMDNSAPSAMDSAGGLDGLMTDTANGAYGESTPESGGISSGSGTSSGSDAGGSSGDGSAIVPITAPVSENLGEKIIYNYYAQIETLKFDETINDINEMIFAHSAFIENSEIRGNTYSSSARGTVSYRYASFVIRVPVGQLNSAVAKLSTLGNIVSQNSNAQNITTQFTDQESRLNALRIQEERLLDMLSKAEDISDMLTIEESLTGVRYQIEHITTTLNNWQRQVDYSTLTLSVQEVEEYQEIKLPEPPVQLTYWEEMGDGLMSTLRSVGDFFAGLFMWLVVSGPVLIILAVIAVVAIIIIKKQMRKGRERRSAKRQAPFPYTAATTTTYNTYTTVAGQAAPAEATPKAPQPEAAQPTQEAPQPEAAQPTQEAPQQESPQENPQAEASSEAPQQEDGASK